MQRCYGFGQVYEKMKGEETTNQFGHSSERPTLFTILHLKEPKHQKGCKTRSKIAYNENAIKKVRGDRRKTEKTIEMGDKDRCLYCIKDLY